MTRIDNEHIASLGNPVAYWGRAAQEILWIRRSRGVWNAEDPRYVSWYPGAMLNTAYNAVDLHATAKRAEQPALVFDSAAVGHTASWTFRELQQEIATLAGALLSLGVEKGDRVLLYMPNVPEAVFAMLACARIGATHVAVSVALGSSELAQRMQQVSPKIVMTASCRFDDGQALACKPDVEAAIERVSNKPMHCVVLQRSECEAEITAGRDHVWQSLCAAAVPADPAALQSGEPLYVLHTAGVEGAPKAVVRDNGGHAVALKWSLKHTFGVCAGETICVPADLATGVGHSYAVYAPLFLGCTTVLYEGESLDPPHPSELWRLVAQHKINALFVERPSLMSLRGAASDVTPVNPHEHSSLAAVFVTGSRIDEDLRAISERAFEVPVLEAWLQVESGVAMAGPLAGLDEGGARRGAPMRAVPGFDVKVLDDSGEALPVGALGHVAIRLPLPPGTLTSLWQNDAGYEAAYLERFAGYFATGDAGCLEADGSIRVMCRSNDLIEIEGAQFSPTLPESVLEQHAEIMECAVVQGNADAVVAFVVLRSALDVSVEDLESDLRALVKGALGSGPRLDHVVCVPMLPRMASGQRFRLTLRRMARGENYRAPVGLRDARVLDGVREALAAKGLLPA